jgi:hypothetical protein
MKYFFAIAWLFTSSCGSQMKPATEDYNKKTGKFQDSSNTRQFFTSVYDRTIEQEQMGVRPPPAYSSWDAEWEETFKQIRRNTDNPEFYVNYIKQRRKELGLPRH